MTKTIKCQRYGLCYYCEINPSHHVICGEAFRLCYNHHECPSLLDITVSTEPLDGGIKVIVIERFLPEGIADAIGVPALDSLMWTGEFYMRAEGLKPRGHTLHWEWLNPRIEC